MPSPEPEHARWFAAELQPHAAALRAFLAAQFPTLTDLDNIVQESLVRVMRAHETRQVEVPRALLFATARNLALDLLRRQRVIAFEPITEKTLSSVVMESGAIPESVSRTEELHLLSQAIQSLPDRCRQVFTLRVAYELSQKEIAARLGISENTVEKQMGNAIRRCSEYFAKLGLP